MAGKKRGQKDMFGGKPRKDVIDVTAAKKVNEAGQTLYTVTMLSLDFDMHRQTVRKKLAGVEPAFQIGQQKLYLLKTVAPHLCGGVVGADGESDELSPAQLNSHYSAELKRLEFEAQMGELIPAEEFRDQVAAVLKVCARNLDVLGETLEERLKLKARSQKLVDSLIEEIRTEMHNELVGFDE